MKRYHRIMTLFAICLFLMSGTAFATIPLTEIALGGITPGTAFRTMQQIYGAPTTSKSAGTHFTTFIYGDSVWATVELTEGRIRELSVTRNNGFQTPAGLHVGMDVQQMKALYGEPSVSEQKAARGVTPATIYSYQGNVDPEEWSANGKYLHHYRYCLCAVTDPGSTTITKLRVERLVL
ncbi:hypothetical protein [uncultured Selenomonas sp.]|uniref:hypothetical protein n=1 Tax=uncultured Selenomonas sp. TaxID=159275 RepID=UPI0025E86E01|nr:hypothetical protein [uncultured Selenomonas sp.]